MKRKITIGVLLTALVAALIGGATMAWFTHNDELAVAEFKAGTVEIKAGDKEIVPMEGREVDNVNPGDCATVIWDIVNTGTKSAELRVKLNDEWTNGWSSDNVFYAPAPGSGWATYTDDSGTWFYYTDGPVDGTYYDSEPTIVQLPIVIAFDGKATDNDYQGESYMLKGIVEAVQSTNGAPAAVWGKAWNKVTIDGINQVNKYFLSKPGIDMPCWTKEAPEVPGEPEDPDVPVGVKKYKVNISRNDEDWGSVSGSGEFAEGESVTVKANPNKWCVFVYWGENGKPVSWNNEYTFIMGSEDVNLVANFR